MFVAKVGQVLRIGDENPKTQKLPWLHTFVYKMMTDQFAIGNNSRSLSGNQTLPSGQLL
jgi:hypothetical protein